MVSEKNKQKVNYPYIKIENKKETTSYVYALYNNWILKFSKLLLE